MSKCSLAGDLKVAVSVSISLHRTVITVNLMFTGPASY